MITEVLTTRNRRSVISPSEARCSQVHPPSDLLQLLEENSAACQIIVTQGVSNAEHISGIVAMHLPKTKQEIRKFLSLLRYCHFNGLRILPSM